MIGPQKPLVNLLYLLGRCKNHFCGTKTEELVVLPNFHQLVVNFCFYGQILGIFWASMTLQKYSRESGGVTRDVE